jgi:hypothetical protein
MGTQSQHGLCMLSLEPQLQQKPTLGKFLRFLCYSNTVYKVCICLCVCGQSENLSQSWRIALELDFTMKQI